MFKTEILFQESIHNYIKDNNNPGALLITGEWGCGKTYFLKELAKKYNSNKEHAIVIISLFGLTSSEEVEEKVKKELCYAMATNNNDENTKDNTSKLYNGFKTLTGIFKDNSKIVNAVDTLVNINYLDFIDLSPEMKNRRIVIIFDDFERCTIDAEILLGIINEYSESIGIKVIIAANIDYLNNESDNENYKKFKLFKEKVIYKTIKMEPQTEFIIFALIDSFNTYDSEYQTYLKTNCESIKIILNKSEYNNFRSIKIAINDFYKVYLLFMKRTQYNLTTKLKPNEEKALSFLLKQFFVLTIETCAGKNILLDYDNELIAAFDEEDKEYTSYLNKYRDIPNYNLSMDCLEYIMPWIANGIYSEEEIEKYIDYCMNLFTDVKKSNLEIFLNYEILSLEDAIFNNGYIDALENAYSGELTYEQYLSLLDRILYAKKINLVLPINPDYDKIHEGILNIKTLSVNDKYISNSAKVYCSLKEYDKQSKELYDLIDKAKIEESNSKAKKIYHDIILNYFSEKDNSNKSWLNFDYDDNINIELTDDLINAFIDSYSSSSNYNRINLSNIFMKIHFSINEDKKQIKKIASRLTELQTDSQLGKIGKINIEEFIQKIIEKYSI